MKTLVADPDALTLELVDSRLKYMSVETVGEKSLEAIPDRIVSDNCDIIIMSPESVEQAKSIMMKARNQVFEYLYFIILSDTLNAEDAARAGANAFLAKPLNPDALEETIENARLFTNLVKTIGDDSEDFPSAGGVIAKSAFNQLFLSAIDRSGRYQEKTYILFITLSNYEDIFQGSGPYAAEYATAKMSQYLVRLRRQSDVIGQTAKYEYALILQHPQHEDEPKEAAKRFAEALEKFNEVVPDNRADVEFRLSLLEVPTGKIIEEYTVIP